MPSDGINEMDPPLCGAAGISHNEVSTSDQPSNEKIYSVGLAWLGVRQQSQCWVYPILHILVINEPGML